MINDNSVFKRYLVWLVGSLLVLALALITALTLLQDRLPPPPITGSVSFDEKAVWLVKHLDTPCDILAIGSSMSVNNLDSSVFPANQFLNASSWGMKIAQTEVFTQLLFEHLDPSIVIMVTAPIDFEYDYRGQSIFDAAKLNDFFTTRNLLTTHLRFLSLTYMASEFSSIARDRHGRQTYYSLDFDSGGSVPLDTMTEGFERVEQRWMKPIAQESMLDPENDDALAKLVRRCSEAGKRFYLIQAPIRDDILSASDRDFLIERHWPKLAKQVRDNGGEFHIFHGQLQVTADDFADSTHLNRLGARRLSEAIVRLLEK